MKKQFLFLLVGTALGQFLHCSNKNYISRLGQEPDQEFIDSLDQEFRDKLPLANYVKWYKGHNAKLDQELINNIEFLIKYPKDVNTKNHIRLLLHMGANPNITTHKRETPLHLVSDIASSNNSVATQVIRLLLEYGAEVNARDDQGRTPLHRAAHTGNVETTNILIAAGADKEAKDTLVGVTPIVFANDNKEMLKLLLEHGASTFVEFKYCKLAHSSCSLIGSTWLERLELEGRKDVLEFVLQNCKDGCKERYERAKKPAINKKIKLNNFI